MAYEIGWSGLPPLLSAVLWTARADRRRRPIGVAWGLGRALCWALPTTVAALIVGLGGIASGCSVRRYGAAAIMTVPGPRRGAMALGQLIVAFGAAGPALRRHEYGHVRQHRMLGPVYLLVIGLPSVLHATWFGARQHWRRCHSRAPAPPASYYRFFTEAWANHLARRRPTRRWTAGS